MTRCSRPRLSGWLLASVWSAGLCVLFSSFTATAYAAGEGEACGRIGPWRETCDEGLRCSVERRSRWFVIGTCQRPACGGLQGLQCPDGQYCEFAPDANCGFADQTGTCQPKPEVCTLESQPVCGCDGQTYGNACAAAAAGVSVEREGSCDACASDADCPHGPCVGGVTCAGLDCPPPPESTCRVCGDGSPLLCLALPAPCPEGEVREVVQNCYGACVDQDSCRPNACEYEGVQYAIGESFPSIDGCNTCSCSDDGSVACTERACSCDPNDPNRSYVSREREECIATTFLCAPGFRQFFDSCGCGCETACRVGGCSGQLCVAPDDPGVSTCEWREEYACYRDATCAQQADGSCGWRETEALAECIEDARAGTAAE